MREGDSRDYIFNLRKGYLKSPSWRRSKKAVSVLQGLIKRHSKIENVRLGRWLNELIWKHGGKNPPSKVKVNIKVEKIKDEKKKTEALVARAELTELPPRAIRLAKLEEEKKSKKKKEAIPEKLEETEKKGKDTSERAPRASAKRRGEKKASRKELQKELAIAKEDEENKKQAKITASMERAMHK